MTGLSPNGDFTKMLKALIGSDFVTRYVPFMASSREEHYKLSDCFCWFWLHFKESLKIGETDYWQHHLREAEIASWRGVAFEEVCMQHVRQIKTALQIAGVSSKESSLIVKGDKDIDGMQIGEDQMIEYGGVAVAPDAPEVEGYTFVRWNQFFNFVNYGRV